MSESVATMRPSVGALDGKRRCEIRLHRATHRKLLDRVPIPADRGAHRAARVAPDVIEQTAPVGGEPGDAGGSVSQAGRQCREERGTCVISGAGAARTVPVAEHEWPDWGREASEIPVYNWARKQEVSLDR